MLYVIDYGFDNLFELTTTNYNTLKLKIGDTTFSLGKDTPVTLDCMPTNIFLFKRVLKTVVGYESKVNGTRLDLDEYNVRLAAVKRQIWDDDEEKYVFETREDKLACETFLDEWVKIYSEPQDVWDEIEFEVIKKQYIDPQYRDFIQSQIIISTNPATIESICQYTPSFEKMFRHLAFAAGFVEVPHQTFSDNTEGKKFSVNDSYKFSKLNDLYVNRYFENKRLFISTKGLYSDCIAAYERDYTAVSDFINLQVAKIEDRSMKSLTVYDFNDLLEKIHTTALQVDSMKSTRSHYNDLLKYISDAKTKLLECLR